MLVLPEQWKEKENKQKYKPHNWDLDASSIFKSKDRREQGTRSSCSYWFTVCYLHLVIKGHVHLIFSFLLCKPQLSLHLRFVSPLFPRIWQWETLPGQCSSTKLKGTHPRRQQNHCVIPQQEASAEQHIHAPGCSSQQKEPLSPGGF